MQGKEKILRLEFIFVHEADVEKERVEHRKDLRLLLAPLASKG